MKQRAQRINIMKRIRAEAKDVIEKLIRRHKKEIVEDDKLFSR